MPKFMVRIPRPDPDIMETSYSFDIMMEGDLIVQVRKRALGDFAAQGLAQKLHDFLSEGQLVEHHKKL